jgi:TonB family protein
MIKQSEYVSGIRRLGICVLAGLFGVAAFSSALALHGDVGALATEAGTATVHAPGADVIPPKVTYSVNLSFPKTARKSPGGVCFLRLTVDVDGNPEDVQVTKSLRPDFDAEAVKAVQQYRFRPATRNGAPVAVALNTKVNFQRF